MKEASIYVDMCTMDETEISSLIENTYTAGLAEDPIFLRNRTEQRKLWQVCIITQS